MLLYTRDRGVENKSLSKGKHLFFRDKHYMNRSGYSKKTGTLRKFKSGTPDESHSDIEKSVKNLYF
jgi:hypothetical protein